MRHDCLAALSPVREVIADKGYDSNELRQWLKVRGTEPVIPPRKWHRNPPAFDESRYCQRSFCRLKDFRRIATRYDKLAKTFLAVICIIATLIWWLN